MENSQQLANLNYKMLHDNVYATIGLDGMKNLCQQKLMPLDIDTEDKNVLKQITTIVYSEDFDKINLYKSRRGYTLLCYSHNIPFVKQYEFMLSLREFGVDSSFMRRLSHQPYCFPLNKDFFVSRIGIKVRNCNKTALNLFEKKIKKDIINISEFLDFVVYYKAFDSKENFSKRVRQFAKKMKFFKDFFPCYERLETLNAFRPIHNLVLDNPLIATKKYIGTIQKDTNLIPKEVENIYDIYNNETGALKENIKFLV
jgi:hypothetical protein